VNKITRSKYSHHEPREMRPTVSVCVCVFSQICTCDVEGHEQEMAHVCSRHYDCKS